MAKRKRAPRGGLTPEKVIDAALKIGNESGLHSVTVRRLAASIGVSPMAIYGHFKSKADIEKQLLNKVIASFDVTSHTELKGRKWVIESFRRIREGLLTHPGVIPLLGTARSISQTSLELLEDILAELSALVGSEEEATEAFYAMISFTIGSVHVEQGMRQAVEGGALDTDNELYSELDPSRAMTLIRTAPVFWQQASEEQFIKLLTKLCPTKRRRKV